jgi:hypothetical protein
VKRIKGKECGEEGKRKRRGEETRGEEKRGEERRKEVGGEEEREGMKKEKIYYMLMDMKNR